MNCAGKLFATAVLCALNMQGQAFAQNITVTQELSFGEGIVTDNSIQQSLTMEFDGDYTADPGILLVTPPQPGIYLLEGVIPFTAISNVTVTVDQQMNGPGEGFTIDNFDINYPPNVDANGEAVIRLGARMRTSGNSNAYSESSIFQSEMTLNVIY